MSDDTPASIDDLSSLVHGVLKHITHDCNRHFKNTDASCVSVRAVTLDVKSFDRNRASRAFLVNV